jgi:hypothetical protein
LPEQLSAGWQFAKTFNQSSQAFHFRPPLQLDERDGAHAEMADDPLSKLRDLGLADLYHAKIVGGARLAERNAGDYHNDVGRLCKILGQRRPGRAINHFLVGVDVAG